METEGLRDRLVELLRSWDGGTMDAVQIRDAAEQLERDWVGWRVLDALPAAEEPPLLAGMAEVLALLSSLEIHWITRTDISPLLACLERMDDDPVAALDAWVCYADGVDWKARGRELRGNTLYVFTER